MREYSTGKSCDHERNERNERDEHDDEIRMSDWKLLC